MNRMTKPWTGYAEPGPLQQSAEAAERDRYVPISDYAIIGDSRSIALVSRGGSIDWWCLPRFDGDPVLAKLIDSEHGGSFEITPADVIETIRTYIPDTPVLITRHRTATGAVCVTDFMPALSEEQKRTHPIPFRCIVRRIRCEEGTVRLRIALRVRPAYGRRGARMKRLRPDAWAIEPVRGIMHLMTPVEVQVTGDVLGTDVELEAGDRIDLAVGFSEEAPADLPVLRLTDTIQKMTIEFWQNWAGMCTYDGRYRDAVVRSALTLKLMTYAPSGAIVAAPTTSLPEWIGGPRNWDYRLCWLRDAGFTIRALMRIGYRREAHAFAHWLLHTTRLTHPRLQVLYTLFGEERVEERLLDWLDGYRGSKPVRIGNAAAQQFQLDVYGEVADALALYHRTGGTFDSDALYLVRGIADVIARRWNEPDFGIWEARAGVRQHVHSKVMAWVGLQRCIELAHTEPALQMLHRYSGVRDEIFRWVMEHGYNAANNTFTATPGHDLDAALLVIPLVDFLPANDPRVIGTVEAIQRRLARGELVYRYLMDDGLPGREGAFVICSFWLVEALARMQRADEATELFERLLTRCNDVGLLSEEIDPESGELLGNFPQAFSHIGLINAALTLGEITGASVSPAAGQVR